MKLINKLLYKRFSKDEYKQLREIISEETKVLLKRPQYIIGNIMMAGLVFYFMVRAFGNEVFEWPKTGDIVGVILGVCAGALVIWLISVRLLRFKFSKLFWAFWVLWMVPFLLIITAQPSSETKWSYLIYAALTLVGWLCSCGSIKEHFSEKILMSHKHAENY